MRVPSDVAASGLKANPLLVVDTRDNESGKRFTRENAWLEGIQHVLKKLSLPLPAWVLLIPYF